MYVVSVNMHCSSWENVKLCLKGIIFVLSFHSFCSLNDLHFPRYVVSDINEDFHFHQTLHLPSSYVFGGGMEAHVVLPVGGELDEHRILNFIYSCLHYDTYNRDSNIRFRDIKSEDSKCSAC